MPIPFGVGVGDFIAGIGLLKEVLVAFSDTKGARASFREVAQELSSLQSALESIRDLEYETKQAYRYVPIIDAVNKCQQCLGRFLRQVSKFRDLLAVPGTHGWSISSLRTQLHKVEWSLCKKSDIEQFRKEIQVHQAAISSLQSALLSTQINDQKELGDRIHDAVGSQHKLVEDIHSKMSYASAYESHECLRTLFVIDPLADRNEIENRKDQLIGDSCSWILSTSAYQDAIDSEGSEFLWIHGEPGKGKTMIAMFLVDVITRIISDLHRDILAYFFCDNTTDLKDNILNALKSILHQILKQSSNNVLLRDFGNQGPQMFSSVEAVWLALMRVLKYSTFRRVHIIIDGLDECDKVSLDAFLDSVTTYIKDKPKSKCKVKWILTSRNEVSIRECLNTCGNLDLEANSDHVARAVDSFIDIKVDELSARKNYDTDLKTWVNHTLREKAEGTFLWVALACIELRKRTVSRINTRLVLGKLPKSLQSLYARIMEQVLDNEIEEMIDVALEILRAVTLAVRPMDLSELAVVSGLPDEARQKRDDAKEYAEQCGSFLTFRDSRVYMVHQSAKDYLLRHQEGMICPYGLIQEHEKIAQRCLQYICQDWREQIVHESSVTVCSQSGKRPNVWNIIENLQYPLLHWIEHSNAATGKMSDRYTLDVEFFRSNSDVRRNWLDYYKTSQHPASISRIQQYKFSALHISSVTNTCWVAKQLLDEDHLKYIDFEDFWGLAPLHWAVQRGNTAMVKLLLEKGANPNNKGRLWRKRGSSEGQFADGPRRGTPLGLAASYNQMEIVRILMEHGARVNETDHNSITPLIWSITKNHSALTTFLLANGANVNMRNPIGKTPLHIAAALGDKVIVRQLIQAGALINAQDIEAYCPVHESAYQGHTNVTRLLVAKGANRWEAEEAEKMGLAARAKEKSNEANMVGTGWSTLRSWGSSQSMISSLKSPAFRLSKVVEPGTTAPALSLWGFGIPE